MSGNLSFNIGNLFTVDADSTILDIFSGLALGLFHAAFYQGFDNVHRNHCQGFPLGVAECAFNFCAAEFLYVTAEESLGYALCFRKAFFPVYETGNFFRQASLCFSLFRMLSYFFRQCVDFFVRR